MMRKYIRIRKYILAGLLFGFTVNAISAPAQENVNNAPVQPVQTAIKASSKQKMCMSVLSGFPSDNASTRYQFLRLVKSFGRGVSYEFKTALNHFADKKITMQTDLVDVIEGMNNPVLRQADPALIAGYGSYLVNFALECSDVVESQISSLYAYDADLKDVAFNIVIDEDALYLRQILSDSLYGLDAQKHPVYGEAVRAYAKGLVVMRDNMEYTVFNAEIGDIEALYMGDLDEKLARSNDIVNAEMDREILPGSVALSDDMSKNMIKQEKRRSLHTLIDILGGLSRGY